VTNCRAEAITRAVRLSSAATRARSTSRVARRASAVVSSVVAAATWGWRGDRITGRTQLVLKK
jgi:hypothetical protein